MILAQKTGAGRIKLCDRIVSIPAGSVGQVELQLEPAGLHGDLAVKLLSPEIPTSTIENSSLELVPAIPGSENRGLATRYLLRTLNRQAGAWNARFGQVPRGVYHLSIDPLGFQRSVVVKAGETTSVEFDLRRIAEVKIWPDTGRREESGTSGPAPGVLHWQVDPTQAVSAGPSHPANLPVGWSTKPASWNGEAWEVTCPPGRLSAAVSDREGHSMGQPLVEQALPGQNEFALDLAPGSGLRIVVRIRGASQVERFRLRRALLDSIVPERGVGRACLVRFSRAVAGDPASNWVAQVDVTEPGTYGFRPGKNWSALLTCPSGKPAPVSPGFPGELWLEGVGEHDR